MVFSQMEVVRMDALQKTKLWTPKEILAKLTSARKRRHESGPSAASVYRFLGGETYVRGREETRGRPSKLPADMVKIANRQRRRLIAEAKNEYLVTWGDVHKATKKELKSKGRIGSKRVMPSEDWLARQVRDVTPVRARPGKRRISKTTEHMEKRYEQALVWQTYPSTTWTKKVHCYIDNKKFVLALTKKQKRLLRSTKVHHHLRTPAEGQEERFRLPKKSRMLLGIPSFDVTAAVGPDGIFFWYVNADRWNGKSAAKMYHELGKALRKKYGNKREFFVVEDGDPKGYQSGLGKDAKKEERICSWTLPPHTPSWMPLDYCLWDEIENRTLKNRAHETEGIKSYQGRMARTARSLPTGLIHRTLGKMKANIEAVVKARGGGTELD